MIAVRIAPDARMIVVAAPSCFESRDSPETPRDLTRYPSINLRLPTYGGFYAWEFVKDGEEIRVRVDGQLAFNGVPQILAAALDGYGLAFVPEDVGAKPIAEGRLVQLLADWRPRFPGYHLYYPIRRQPSPAFTLILDALRWQS